MGLKVSVVILNYFGEKVIAKTVTSVLNSVYPKKDYEIIIVDNASRDDSRRILNHLSKKYKNIKLLFLDKNYGFAKGNNQGIKIAQGKYIVLLNNDCLIDKNCLSELITTAESDDSIFSVGAKVLIYPKYFNLPLNLGTDNIILGINLIRSHLLDFTDMKFLKVTFSSDHKSDFSIPYDNTHDHLITVELTFASRPDFQLIDHLKNNQSIFSLKRQKNKITIDINTRNAKIINSSFSKIQNAGTIVFQDGYARDIGAKVKFMHQEYETDTGQYNTLLPVYAICGAAVLLKKDILNKIGLLNESFFMYYEDIELSERARLMGYTNYYCPQAVVRHLHALSSHEWSPFFIYHTEKGRLLHLFYHFPPSIFLKEYSKFLILALSSLLNFKNSFSKNFSYLKVALWFPKNIFTLFHQKRQYSLKYSPLAVNKNYLQILSGYWLTN